MTVRLHAFESATLANGPGRRAVVWFQGCSLRCPGCFNPATHDPLGGYETDTEWVVREILAAPGIEGVSISGGEPFQQPEALADLTLRLRHTPLSILVFSGYTLDHIRALALGPRVLANLDVLIAGPYIQARRVGAGLLGSANQRIHLLTNRYSPRDFASIPTREVIVHRDGSVTITGIVPFSLPASR